MLPLLFGVLVHLVSCAEDANKDHSSKHVVGELTQTFLNHLHLSNRPHGYAVTRGDTRVMITPQCSLVINVGSLKTFEARTTFMVTLFLRT